MRKTTLLTATLAFALLGASTASAQGVQLVPFGGQAFNSPYYVTGAPGDPSRVFVVEGGGTIRLVKDGVTQGAPFLSIGGDVCAPADGCGSESGLFSMAPAPDYSASGRFYVFYTRDASPGEHVLRIEEFRRSASNPDVADAASRRIVLEIPHLNASNHNGGQLQFGPDKLLYAATGDGGGGQSANAQNPGSLLGKLLRIDPAGSTQVYSTGLRNPYRFSFDRSTGDLTIGDVGEGSWEEIDYKPEGGGSGANFGWNCFEGFVAFSGCSLPNHSRPALVYQNSTGPAAVSGGYVIRDSALPGLAGRYVYADSYNALGGQLHSAVLGPGPPSAHGPLGLSASGVSSFGQDACGHIYVATFSGTVFRIQPTSGPFPCKVAPGLTVETKSARRAAAKGAVVIKALCDEDCDLSSKAFVVIRRGGSASSAKRGRRGRVIPAVPVNVRLQLGRKARLRFDLSKKRTRRLRKVLARGGKAVAKVHASASGGGGGTTTVNRKVKQRR
jgi:glucose/arabinose dehydrogenase